MTRDILPFRKPDPAPDWHSTSAAVDWDQDADGRCDLRLGVWTPRAWAAIPPDRRPRPAIFDRRIGLWFVLCGLPEGERDPVRKMMAPV